MNSKNKLVKFLNKQILLENHIVDSLNSVLLETKNPIVKGILRGISLDSMKHAEIYATAVSLLTQPLTSISQDDIDKHKDRIEDLIRSDEELIKGINDAINSVENEKVKLLLNAILLDEKTNHELLKLILEIILQSKVITEDEWWEILWRNVPFHGAPGG